MANKLYVGNLSYSTEEASLQNLFAQYGEVASVNIVTDRVTGAQLRRDDIDTAAEVLLAVLAKCPAPQKPLLARGAKP